MTKIKHRSKGRPTLYSTSSREKVKCLTEGCSYEGRSDKFRRHYKNNVNFNQQTNLGNKFIFYQDHEVESKLVQNFFLFFLTRDGVL